MKNILIVDNDLGFVFWLGEVLAGANYQPWPACSVSEALPIMDRKLLIPLDLLIVNPSLPGASHLIAHSRRSQAELKVIALGSNNERVTPAVDAWRRKPNPADLSAGQKWVRAIDRMFSGHKRAA